MRRKLWVLFLATVLLILPAAVASAHDGPVEGVYHQDVQVGPYPVAVSYVDWPLQALKSNRLIVRPQGGIEGKSGHLTLTGPNGKVISVNLLPYPGLQGAWMFETAGLPVEGEWTMKLDLQGPDGAGTLTMERLVVAPPPGIPMWFGWLLGLFPVYGMVWFGYREVKRLRRQKPDEACW